MFFDSNITIKAQEISNILRKKQLKVSFAESCTGGLVSAIITEIPNASEIFESSFITYSNQSKIDLLNVNPNIINKFGAVSKECAKEMSYGLLKHNYCDIALAITGIAGPASDNTKKDIGLIYLFCTIKTDLIVKLNINKTEFFTKLDLGNIGRSEIRIKTAIAALNMINNIFCYNN